MLLKLDLDRPTQFMLLRAYFLLRYLGADVYTFRTNKGWHIYAAFNSDSESTLDLRAYLGDDPGRIEFDEIREKLGLYDWEDTLFAEKYIISRRGIRKVHSEIESNPLYEPFHIAREKISSIGRKKFKYFKSKQ